MIGIIICRCNDAISIDFERIIKEIKGADADVIVDNAICIKDDVWKILKERNYDKLIIAACSPQFHEITFLNKMRKHDISIPYTIVNIREHAAFVHDDHEKLYKKVKAQIKAAVEKIKLVKNVEHKHKSSSVRNILIIGGGISGLKAAELLEKHGFKCYIIEKSNKIGGIVKDLPYVYPYNISGRELIENILKNLKNTEIITNAEIINLSGGFGNYDATVIKREGNLIEIIGIKASAIVISTGIEEWKPYDIAYLKYGRDSRIITQLELSEKIKNGEEINGERILMQLCVGSRDEKFFSYCSKICCIYTLENAIRLKEKGKDVIICYMDIRTTWKAEELFNKARELGVKFIRGKVSNVDILEDKLRITVENTLENKIEEFDIDMLVLASALKAPDDNRILSQILNVEVDEYGFFKKLYPKLRCIETRRRGIYVIGGASEPKGVEECILEAEAVAKKIITEIFTPEYKPRAKSKINIERCIGCQICYKICPHKAIEMILTENGEKAYVIEENCKSCGACVANCPTGAAQLEGYTTEEMLKYIDTLLNEVDFEKKIAVFVCYECGYAALDMIGLNGLKYPEEFLIIPVTCLARVGALEIFKALSSGANGVLLIGCLDNGCHYLRGNEYASYIIEICRDILEAIGLDKRKVDLIKVVNADYYKLHEKLLEFYKIIKEVS